MKNTMIDPKELDDLQIAGFPSLVVTDEIMLDLEKGFIQPTCIKYIVTGESGNSPAPNLCLMGELK